MRDPAIVPVLAERFSAARFDPDAELDDATVDALIAAAGSAPSAGNSQPWSFIVGRRSDAVHRRIVPHLARGTSRWAPDAALLVGAIARTRVEASDLPYSEFAHYDTGQAMAYLTVQAHATGLSVHQFRGFDREALAAEFAVPDHLELLCLAAVGPAHPESPATPPEGAAVSTSRDRLAPSEITWTRATGPTGPR